MRLARTMEGESAAKELIVMAASLHDRAVKLEAPPALSRDVAEVLQANEGAWAGPPAGKRTPEK